MGMDRHYSELLVAFRADAVDLLEVFIDGRGEMPPQRPAGCPQGRKYRSDPGYQPPLVPAAPNSCI